MNLSNITSDVSSDSTALNLSKELGDSSNGDYYDSTSTKTRQPDSFKSQSLNEECNEDIETKWRGQAGSMV